MLYIYPMDFTGCGQYRILHPYRAMPPEVTGGTTKIVEPGSDGGVSARFHGDRPMSVHVPEDCTGVLVQRPTSQSMVALLAHLRSLGLEVIVEIDDDLESLPAGHPASEMLRLTRGHDSICPRLAAMQATRVVVSTEALRRKYEAVVPDGVPVFLCRNRVPEKAIRDPWTPTGDHVVGWPGAVSTHPGDLDMLGGAVAQVGLGFTIVGGEEAEKPHLGIDDELLRYTGKVDFDEWIPTIAETLTVGVVPLRDTTFNRAKSNLKAMELAAAGVPCVTNTLPEFLNDGGDVIYGLPARRPREWASAIRRLVGDPELWADTQASQLDAVRDNTYEGHWEEFAIAWGLA